MTAHIVVIDPAVMKPELSAFNRMAINSPLPLTLHLPALYGTTTLLRDNKDVRGVVILGSKASVTENFEWQSVVSGWLKERWAQKIPTLGFCYGHQLIAHLFGGKVGFAFPDKSKRVGFRKVTLKPNRLWNLPKEGCLYFSHEETVLDVPSNMNLLATSADVPVEGLEHRELPVWSLQTHPETVCVQDGVARQDGDLDFGHSLVNAFLKTVAR